MAEHVSQVYPDELTESPTMKLGKSQSKKLQKLYSKSMLYPDEPRELHFTRLYGPRKPSPIPTPATYKKPRKRRSLCSLCCCFFTTLSSILFVAVLALGVAALVIWLVLRPIHAPTYSLDDLQFKSFTVKSESTLTANFVYKITAKNANKKIGFKYDVINIDSSYGGVVIGNSAIPSFYQSHLNVTTLTSETEITNFALGPSLGSSLNTDVNNGRIPLKVLASAKVHAKIGTFTSFAVKVHVNCDVSVSPPTVSSPSHVYSQTCKLTR